MTEIKLTKRYPNSRTEDITDAYMRGWNDALDAVQNGKFHIAEQTEPMKTTDYCDICNHEGCENCVADSTNPYCIPSNYKQTEPTTEDCSTVETMSCQECKHWNDGECGHCGEGYICEYEPSTDCSWK